MQPDQDELEGIENVNTCLQNNALKLTQGRLTALQDQMPHVEGQLLASEWVICANWVDQGSLSIWTMHFPPSTLRTHAKGLLHVGLYET